jgi:hypothetical protein
VTRYQVVRVADKTPHPDAPVIGFPWMSEACIWMEERFLAPQTWGVIPVEGA